MDDKFETTKDKIIILEKVILYKKDLIRALSWIDFVPDREISPEDEMALINLLKIINYLTRNG